MKTRLSVLLVVLSCLALGTGAALAEFPEGVPDTVQVDIGGTYSNLDTNFGVSSSNAGVGAIVTLEDVMNLASEQSVLARAAEFSASQAALNSRRFPAAARILISKSHEMETTAPFLTAETLERATPDLFTISFTVSPLSSMALTAKLESKALCFIKATSAWVSPSFFPSSSGVRAIWIFVLAGVLIVTNAPILEETN